MRNVTVLGRVVADYLPFPKNHPFHQEGFLRNHFLIEGVEVELDGSPQIVKLRYTQNSEFHNLILKFPISPEMAKKMQQITESTNKDSSSKKKPQWWGSLTFEVKEGEDWAMPFHHRTVKSRGKGATIRVSHMLMSANAAISCEYMPNKIKKITETEFSLKLQDAIEWAESAFDPSILLCPADKAQVKEDKDIQEALTQSFTQEKKEEENVAAR